MDKVSLLVGMEKIPLCQADGQMSLRNSCSYYQNCTVMHMLIVHLKFSINTHSKDLKFLNSNKNDWENICLSTKCHSYTVLDWLNSSTTAAKLSSRPKPQMSFGSSPAFNQALERRKEGLQDLNIQSGRGSKGNALC